MKTLNSLFIFFCITTSTYCYSQIVVVISGSDPLGPTSLEEALNDLDSSYFQRRLKELKPTNELEFIKQHEFELGRYIRREWGVFGGPNLFKTISQDSDYSPRSLNSLILSSYYRTFYDNTKSANQEPLLEIEPTPKPKKYIMQFKVRDGVDVPNSRIKIARIETEDYLNTSLGTLYPTGKKVGDLVVKKPIKEYLDDWLLNKFSTTTNQKVEISIREFYSEIAARTWGTEMAVYLSIDLISSEITRNCRLTEFFEPKMVYTGVNVNKALEKLLEKALTEFNNELGNG